MRILQVVHQFPPRRVGGTEIYTENLARELGRRGHDVLVFYAEENITPGEEEETASGFRVHRVFYPSPDSPLRLFFLSFRNPFVERSFAHLLERERPDIVHFQHLKGLSARLVPLVKSFGLPTVYSLHDYWLFCANAQLITPGGRLCQGPVLWLNCAQCAAMRIQAPHLLLAAPIIASLFYYRARILRKAVDSIDTFLAPTAFVRDTFVKKGVPGDKIRQMELGIYLFEEGHFEWKMEGPLRVSYIGNLAWQKGVHILIQAFSRLDEDRTILNIYGGEDTFPRYAQELHLLARGPNIHFMGSLPRERLWLALAETDILVIPSLWHETFSLVALEAFAAGVPVIASRLGGLAERINHGQDGFLFRPGDPDDLARYLQLLIDEPTALESLRRNVRPPKPITQVVGEVEKLYQELTGISPLEGCANA